MPCNVDGTATMEEQVAAKFYQRMLKQKDNPENQNSFYDC